MGIGMGWQTPGASRASRKGDHTSTPLHLSRCPGICCTEQRSHDDETSDNVEDRDDEDGKKLQAPVKNNIFIS